MTWMARRPRKCNSAAKLEQASRPATRWGTFAPRVALRSRTRGGPPTLAGETKSGPMGEPAPCNVALQSQRKGSVLAVYVACLQPRTQSRQMGRVESGAEQITQNGVLPPIAHIDTLGRPLRTYTESTTSRPQAGSRPAPDLPVYLDPACPRSLVTSLFPQLDVEPASRPR